MLVQTLILCLLASTVLAGDLQSAFNRRYQDYFGSDSQSMLPFPSIEKSEWQALRQNKSLELVYQEPNKYYNSKIYVFSMYRDTQSGRYYLQAKGGFWGMDELIYGPMALQELEGSANPP